MSTASAPMPDSHHRSRHLPPFAGGAQTTGWEALDKWVGGSGAAGGTAKSAPAGGGKTGWEALDKWVGSAPAGGGKTTGWEALDKWVGEGKAPAKAAASSSGGASSGGGFMAWLKRLFGGR